MKTVKELSWGIIIYNAKLPNFSEREIKIGKILLNCDMKSRVSQAVERKKSCNCAQAVACTYCDLAGVGEDEMMRLTSGFGLGMGNMEGTCGAITGASVVIGGVIGDRNRARMAMARLMEMFQKRNGATICGELKGRKTGKMLRACPDCVADASEFLERILEETDNL